MKRKLNAVIKAALNKTEIGLTSESSSIVFTKMLSIYYSYFILFSMCWVKIRFVSTFLAETINVISEYEMKRTFYGARWRVRLLLLVRHLKLWGDRTPHFKHRDGLQSSSAEASSISSHCYPSLCSGCRNPICNSQRAHLTADFCTKKISNIWQVRISSVILTELIIQ